MGKDLNQKPGHLDDCCYKRCIKLRRNPVQRVMRHFHWPGKLTRQNNGDVAPVARSPRSITWRHEDAAIRPRSSPKPQQSGLRHPSHSLPFEARFSHLRMSTVECGPAIRNLGIWACMPPCKHSDQVTLPESRNLSSIKVVWGKWSEQYPEVTQG